jgi:protein TonB
MSAAAAVEFRIPALPWSVNAEDETRFKRILRNVLVICAAVALVMPWLSVTPPDRAAPPPLPPRLAQVLLEKSQPPPPPKVEKAPERETKSAQPDVPRPEKLASVVQARKPEPDKAPGERLANARARASGVGLLAMKDEIADLRGAPAAAQLRQDIKPGAGVGTGEGPGVGSGVGPGVPQRSLITSNATGGSGGINTSRFARDTGGGGLAGRSTTLVEGVAGGRGGGGAGGAGGGSGAGGTLQRGASGKASRSIEEIKIVFERNKGAIYAIYNRALREDPALQGKVVLELKIAPSGQVVDLRLVSSELKSPELERRLLARIRQFDFGAKDVDTMTVTWPVDFLPS